MGHVQVVETELCWSFQASGQVVPILEVAHSRNLLGFPWGCYVLGLTEVLALAALFALFALVALDRLLRLLGLLARLRLLEVDKLLSSVV